MPQNPPQGAVRSFAALATADSSTLATTTTFAAYDTTAGHSLWPAGAVSSLPLPGAGVPIANSLSLASNFTTLRNTVLGNLLEPDAGTPNCWPQRHDHRHLVGQRPRADPDGAAECRRKVRPSHQRVAGGGRTTDDETAGRDAFPQSQGDWRWYVRDAAGAVRGHPSRRLGSTAGQCGEILGLRAGGRADEVACGRVPAANRCAGSREKGVALGGFALAYTETVEPVEQFLQHPELHVTHRLANAVTGGWRSACRQAANPCRRPAHATRRTL